MGIEFVQKNEEGCPVFGVCLSILIFRSIKFTLNKKKNVSILIIFIFIKYVLKSNIPCISTFEAKPFNYKVKWSKHFVVNFLNISSIKLNKIYSYFFFSFRINKYIYMYIFFFIKCMLQSSILQNLIYIIGFSIILRTVSGHHRVTRKVAFDD